MFPPGENQRGNDTPTMNHWSDQHILHLTDCVDQPKSSIRQISTEADVKKPQLLQAIGLTKTLNNASDTTNIRECAT